ncbi:hypothetical protein G7Y89_g11739 [Cudoniella acicularis]|uniref:Glycoprotease family protein n=1 Tax=Cudoniella acicularis TaxID=354080 RepID=A0A8H4RAD1_9HELO|nr:hypothetical protein G7Y89_g11739 [Cudoniella acicularis]
MASTKPNTSEVGTLRRPSDNPYGAPFGGDSDDEGDEWWDEEDSKSSHGANMLGVTQWAQIPEGTSTGLGTKSVNRSATRKHNRKYSVQKPTRDKSKGRQKKQNAQAGIKVVTDFTTQKSQTQATQHLPQIGAFVDLATLRAMDGESKQSSGPFWRSRKNKGSKDTTRAIAQQSSETSGPRTLKSIPNPMFASGRRESTLMPSHDFRADLSPNDRPIVIGLSIPSSDVSVHSVSPQTATSLQVPETPTIIITPAQEGSVWSPFDEGSDFSGHRARPASSIYSQNVAGQEKFMTRETPPVPQVPSFALKEEQQRQAALKSCFSPDSDDGTTWDATQYSPNDYSSRIMSSCTVFEEDESPVIARRARGLSVSVSQAGKHASVSTVATNRRSKGWWNYITTPFLTRSNTFAIHDPEQQQPPALPNLAIAVEKAQNDVRDVKSWEKQFSPLTPETSTTIQSYSWWNVDSKDAKSAGPSPVNGGTKHKLQASTATVPFMLSDAHEEEVSRLSNISDHSQSHLENVSRELQHANPSTIPIVPEEPNTTMQSNNPYVQPPPQGQHNPFAHPPAMNHVVQPAEPVQVVVLQHPAPVVHIQQSQPAFQVLPPPAPVVHYQQSQPPFEGHPPPAPVANYQQSQPSFQGYPSSAPEDQSQQNEASFEALPPPPYSAAPSRMPRYRAVFPPGGELNVQHSAPPEPVAPVMQRTMPSTRTISTSRELPPASPEPMAPVMQRAMTSTRTISTSRELPLPSPGPVSPGLQQAMASTGAIPMSNVPLTPAGRGPINLNSSYPRDLPPRQNNTTFIAEFIDQNSSKKARKIEEKRKRHEKEDAVARKAGGWWRGRGCIPKKGCYGRKGVEGRKKRRCYIALIVGFLLLIILILALVTTLSRKPSSNIGPSQWLNLTGFPPIFTGLSTVAVPDNTVTNTGCVVPSTQWSCDLPKELQASVAPNQPNQPNFLLNIQWDNSSSTNATFANVTGNPNLVTRAVGGNPVSAGQYIKRVIRRAAQIITFVPSPEPPTFAEEFFLGNTTDGIISSQKAGEPTPFYISFLPTTNSSIAKRNLIARQSNDSSSFPDPSALIPPPSLGSDGTAAPANLLPFPVQQPIRLYDRGLPSEHYGFYTYYDRSIFLKSLDINATGGVSEDQSGGADKDAAQFRCTWTQTRFLVQMWTRMNTTAQLLNGTHTTKNPATDFSQPGSFPYPITITVDRHGGDAQTKMLYCYPMTDQEEIKAGTGQIMEEERDFGGTIINPAAALFFNASNPSLGGFDGGTGGCKCQWDNFQGVVG